MGAKLEAKLMKIPKLWLYLVSQFIKRWGAKLERAR